MHAHPKKKKLKSNEENYVEKSTVIDNQLLAGETPNKNMIKKLNLFSYVLYSSFCPIRILMTYSKYPGQLH